MRALPPRAESDLVRRAARGDREAFGELVKRYQRPVVSFAYRCLAQREEAEDVAQDAFVRVYFSLPRLRDPSRFSPYLFATVLNLCRRRAKHQHSLQRAAASGAAPDGAEAPSPPVEALRRADHDQLAQAIAALPLDYRETVSLRVDGDLSFAEIAEIVGATTEACRVRYHRAKQMLQAALVPSGAAAEEPT